MTYTWKLNSIDLDYKIGNYAINRVFIYKDLGVLFDLKFLFASYTNDPISRANKQLDLIF